MKNSSEPRFNKEDIEKAAEVINSGGIIIYPSDTIWGIGCDATNAEAVDKIYALKKRDPEKAMIVLIDHENKLDYYVREVPEVAFQLIEVSEKPLTIIFQGAKNLPPNLPASDGSIALRVCHDSYCKELMRRTRKPLVSTSANFSGQPSPESFKSIDPALLKEADYVCQFRQDELSRNQPSTIISLGSGGQVKVIRK